ncbi:MarR family transcriptional regulator [Microbacterium marmarense]|uniref:MarR family transcriptional regulator n=1 Tax=Microbacterium marmarense TaxID=3122051 RepID=A0ABU8LR54_9MICO
MTNESPPDAPASGDLTSEASNLRIATFRLARRMRTQRAVDSMSDGQFAVLAVLWTFGDHALSELAERERISPPAMNRTVNCLEKSGYLSRNADESDGRKVVISLTDEGRAVVKETARRRDAWIEEALDDLDASQRDVLAAAAVLMQRMVDR